MARVKMHEERQRNKAKPERRQQARDYAHKRYWSDPEFRERVKAKARAKTRNEKRAQRYGVSISVIEALEERAGGLCESCGEKMGKECLDHSHEPPCELRAFLCEGCNVALGRLGDCRPGTVARILALAKYASRFEHGRG